MTMLINNWGVMNLPCSPFTAPECRPNLFVLHGKVEVHRELGPTNGKNITTSPITKVAGRLVFTESGSCYKLGTTNEGWKNYLAIEWGYWQSLVDSADNPIPDAFLKEMGLK